jgi:hypothetical protein
MKSGKSLASTRGNLQIPTFHLDGIVFRGDQLARYRYEPARIVATFRDGDEVISTNAEDLKNHKKQVALINAWMDSPPQQALPALSALPPAPLTRTAGGGE